MHPLSRLIGELEAVLLQLATGGSYVMAALQSLLIVASAARRGISRFGAEAPR
tara:strand:- start:15751 stop:15909 length:159 start_codon:yes stop_codon:yes gene_type:complete